MGDGLVTLDFDLVFAASVPLPAATGWTLQQRHVRPASKQVGHIFRNFWWVLHTTLRCSSKRRSRPPPVHARNGVWFFARLGRYQTARLNCARWQARTQNRVGNGFRTRPR